MHAVSYAHRVTVTGPPRRGYYISEYQTQCKTHGGSRREELEGMRTGFHHAL